MYLIFQGWKESGTPNSGLHVLRHCVYAHGGNHLVLFVQFLLDGLKICCAGLVVQDLEVHFVAALFDSPVDVFVCDKALTVVLGAEGID